MSKKPRKCGICKNYLISDNTFTSKVTNKKYYIKKYNDFDCNCVNAICLISCTNCYEQYVDSAIDFKILINVRAHCILMLS